MRVNQCCGGCPVLKDDVIQECGTITPNAWDKLVFSVGGIKSGATAALLVWANGAREHVDISHIAIMTIDGPVKLSDWINQQANKLGLQYNQVENALQDAVAANQPLGITYDELSKLADSIEWPEKGANRLQNYMDKAILGKLTDFADSLPTAQPAQIHYVPEAGRLVSQPRDKKQEYYRRRYHGRRR